MLRISLLFLSSIFFLASCGGGNSGSKTGNSPVLDTEIPQFDGIVQLSSGNNDRATLVWMPANDNATASDNIRYDLHFDTDPNFVVDDTNLYQTYIGETTSDVTGLDADTTYYFKIVVIDNAGNINDSSAVGSVKTSTLPTVINSFTTVNQTEQLNLGIPQIDVNEIYTFPRNANSIEPAVGSVITGEDSEGNGYLRKVVNVTENVDSYVVETTESTLAELFESAVISSEVTLLPLDNQTVSGKAFQQRPNTSVKVSDKPNYRFVQWKDNVLQATETNASEMVNSKAKILGLDNSATKIDVKASESLSLTGTMEFVPTVTTRVDIGFAKVTHAEALVSGTLNMDVELVYDYKEAEKVTATKQIFKRMYLSRYLVGEIPVYQETTLTLDAEFEGNADLAVSASTKAHIGTNVTVEVIYDGNQWSATTNENYEESLTVKAQSQGTATAKVRIIPSVKVRFYRVATAAISVEPYTRAEVAAQAVTEAELVSGGYMDEYGFTKFDAYWGVDVNVMADLSVFSHVIARYPEEGTKTLYNKEEKLFGLPTLSAVAQQTDINTYKLTGNAEPFIAAGLENAFDVDSATWVVFPDSTSLKGMEVNYTGTIEKAYFIGNSEMLGPVARQYIDVPISAIINDDIFDLGPFGLPPVEYYGPYSLDCITPTLTVKTRMNVGETIPLDSWLKIDLGTCVIDEIKISIAPYSDSLLINNLSGDSFTFVADPGGHLASYYPLLSSGSVTVLTSPEPTIYVVFHVEIYGPSLFNNGKDFFHVFSGTFSSSIQVD